MRDSALQIHILEPEQRAASRLRALLLPPLALFAALWLVFASVLSLPLYAPALLCGAAVIAMIAFLPGRAARGLGIAVVLGAALAFVLLSSVRDGAAALINRLYDASEAVNAYAYDRFAVADEAAVNAALIWLAVPGGILCALAARRRLCALALFFALAFAEAYFGVTPPMWQNLLIFALLALLSAQGKTDAESGALLVGIACAALAVFLLAPRPNAAVEAYSEQLRDELGAAAMRVTRQVSPPEDETNRVREESRQHEESARADEALSGTAQEFERRTQDEEELALPQRIDYLKIALWLLLAVAALTVPFVPFWLLERAKRRAAETRAAFADADNAAAIRAMFAHTMDWLRAGGLQTENRPFAQCEEAVEALTSRPFAERYASAASIWQEAAYSDHAMSDEQRKIVRELLDAAAATLYEKADRRTRFRMKYIACLCGS